MAEEAVHVLVSAGAVRERVSTVRAIDGQRHLWSGCVCRLRLPRRRLRERSTRAVAVMKGRGKGQRARFAVEAAKFRRHVRQITEQVSRRVPCRSCFGSGQCQSCLGTGRMMIRETRAEAKRQARALWEIVKREAQIEGRARR